MGKEDEIREEDKEILVIIIKKADLNTNWAKGDLCFRPTAAAVGWAKSLF